MTSRAHAMIGNSPAMCRLRAVALRAAPTDASVLLNGPSGSGKEILARFIHSHSGRGPFIGMNCAALPEGLAEAQLFGHEKGSFTGAASARKGCFEAAEGGTLLLDEITEVGLHIQAKLLRIIQEREVRRVGSTTPRKIDVRILAASARDPHEAIETGRLREDLYYRLAMIELKVPRLRDRKQDLAALCRYFLDRYAERFDSPLRFINLNAFELLEAYEWPGNVRELSNVLGRASVFADSDTLRPGDVPAKIRGGVAPVERAPEEDGLSLRTTVQRAKRHCISRALRASNGNKREAARLLGISRRGLYNLLDEIDVIGL